MLLSGEICLDSGEKHFPVEEPAGHPVYQAPALQAAFACQRETKQEADRNFVLTASCGETFKRAGQKSAEAILAQRRQ
jgi:hypothetical protein